MKRLWLTTLLLGCAQERATSEDCAQIFARIVVLELQEAGYRDPEVAVRRQQELMERFEPDIRACVGRQLRPGALECVGRSTSTEELCHRCFR